MLIIKSKPLKIGHKGASLIAPENTLLAFKKAIDLKADYVEFDIHLTKDNEIVISHDGDTLRTTGVKKIIRDSTLEELKALDAGEGEKIPTLTELIRLSDGKLKLQPEIKAQGIAEPLIDILRETRLIETIIISSFDITELIRVKEIEPNVRIGYLIPSEITRLNLLKRYLKKALKNDFFALHPHFNSITSDFVDFVHENGLEINVWTVNDRTIMRELINLGVEGIITDDLALLNELVEDIF